MIKHKEHRSIFFLCATLLWVGLWVGLWTMVPTAPVYAQAESTATDEEDAEASADDEEQEVEEKAPEPPKNLRTTQIKGMLPGGKFTKFWLGLEPAFFGANINMFAEWDRPNALQKGLGFYILDEAGLRQVVEGQQQARNVSIASGDDVFEGFDHQMDATFKAPAQAKYTIVIFNDSQGDANFTMNATNAFISDDSGQVEDVSEAAEEEEVEEEEEEGDDSSDAEEDPATEESVIEEPTATPEPTEAPVVVVEEADEESEAETVTEEVAEEVAEEAAPESIMPKVVEEMVLSGDLPTQFSMHFLSVRPSVYNGTIDLHLQFDPRDNSEILRKLNFWVLDAQSLQLYFDPNEEVRLHEIASAAGSPTFRGFSNERAASFQALQFSEYTVIVYNDANVPGNYILTVEGGILIDRDNQTNEAKKGGSAKEEMVEDEAEQDTEETAAVEVVPEIPTPVPPTVAPVLPTPVPPTPMPIPPTAAPIGPAPTLPAPSLPPTPVPPPPTPVPPPPPPPTPVPPPPTPVPPPPPPPTPVPPPPPPPTPVPPPPPPPTPVPPPTPAPLPTQAPVVPNAQPQPPMVNPAPVIDFVIPDPQPGLMLNPLFVPIPMGFEFAPGITPQPFFIPDPNYVQPTPVGFVPDTSTLSQPAGLEPAPVSPSAPGLPPTPVPLPTIASAAPAREGIPGGTYVVKTGDSAALIARDIYGDYKFFNALCSFNGLSNCNVIEVGDTLNLPTQEQISAGIDTTATSTSSSTSSSASSSTASTSSATTSNVDTSAVAENASPTEAPTAVPTEAPTAAPAEVDEPAPIAPAPDAAGESLDIVDTLIGAGNFKNLVTALEATNLSGPLRTPGPFTLFAPSDTAFDALPAGALQQLLANPEGQLTQILLYHVIPGQLYSNALGDGEEVPTQQGSSIFFEVSDNFITVNGANVSVFDIQSTNGVIHVIDAVILPPID